MVVLRKKGIIVLLVLVLLVSVVGCSKEKKEYSYDVKQLAASLKDDITYKDDMSELNGDMFDVLYNIDPSLVEEKAVYVSTGATAEEIVVVKAKDKDSVEAIKTALTERVNDQKESYESYLPAEMPKLNDPVLEVRGTYIILCLSDDNKKALEIIGK